MRIPTTPVSGFRPIKSALIAISFIGVALTACKQWEEPGAHVAGWTLVDPSQRHPILVSQQPATLSLNVPRGSQGLSSNQQAQVADFLERYRASDTGNSKLVIAAPSGSANETAAMHTIGALRQMISEFGFSDSAVAIEPYRAGRDASAPIRLSYLRYVAEGPDCGHWPTNLADEPRNLHYPNFGCAQQRNLAAQIANPADLLGPRTMDPADAERRAVIAGKYRKGTSTVSEKSGDERVQVKGAN